MENREILGKMKKNVLEALNNLSLAECFFEAEDKGILGISQRECGRDAVKRLIETTGSLLDETHGIVREILDPEEGSP